MTDTMISFGAIVAKVQSMSDGGWRVSFDGDASTRTAAAALLAAASDDLVVVTVRLDDSVPFADLPDEGYGLYETTVPLGRGEPLATPSGVMLD